MLVLTFRKDEEAMISLGGKTVLVKFLRTDGAKIKLGFDAPTDVQVDRASVYADKLRLRQSAEKAT